LGRARIPSGIVIARLFGPRQFCANIGLWQTLRATNVLRVPRKQVRCALTLLLMRARQVLRFGWWRARIWAEDAAQLAELSCAF